VELVS
jgi:hypothetical protein